MNRYWSSFLLISLASFLAVFLLLILPRCGFHESFLNFLFKEVISGSSVTWFIWGPVLAVSSVIPSFFIQSNPIKGLVFFVVIKISRLFRCPFTSTVAVVFPSKRILLSFTSLYSVFSGFNGVILLEK